MYCRVVVIPVQSPQKAVGWHSTSLKIAVSFDVIINNHEFASSNCFAFESIDQHL